MICDVCKQKFTGTTEQSIGGDGLSLQVVGDAELVRGLCDEHKWHEVSQMNTAINRQYGW
jgi:hypothetical protein